ncbi:MAG: aspartyl/asparaginyl beta-hydroxylase domain-containing protein [Acidimicrobiales bacterium]|nr:aspartyl/asparaginyl beta-hydroxylase domain-containing protein [Acidimicrobiales bacterium]
MASRAARSSDGPRLIGLGQWVSRYWDALRWNVPYWPVMVYNVVLWLLLPGRKLYEPEDVPGCEVLADNWQVIREELDDLLRSQQPIPAFQEVDPGQRRLTDDDGWKSFLFRLYGADVNTNRERCPKTAHVLDEVPGLYTAFFSILEPYKRIPIHSGPLKGLIRYHLPLIVPDGGECWIEIGGEVHHWREGEPLIFDDTYLHRVRNDTDQHRVVFFIDIERPMPWPWLQRLNRWVLGRMTRSRRIQNAVANAARAAEG